MQTISTYSNVNVTVLNNHSGVELFEKVVIVYAPSASSKGLAYAKTDINEWVRCSVSVCCVDGSLSAYFDVDCDTYTDSEVTATMLGG